MDKRFIEIAGEIRDVKDFAFTRLNYSQLEAAANSLNPLDLRTNEIPGYDLIRIMSTPNYLFWASKILLNITVNPMQSIILEELWKRKFPMLIGSRGLSKCVTKDTFCITERGVLNFEEFLDLGNKTYKPSTPYFDNTKFYGENGWNNIEYSFYNGLTKTIKITNNLGIELEGTYDHPIRAIRNNKIEWVKLEGLKVGDVVPIHRKYIKLKNNHADITTDIAWWLGATLGDGMISQPDKILFTNTDKELIDKWCSIGEKLFGKSAGFIAPNNYVFYSKKISNHINHYFQLYNKKAHDKNVPQIIREAGSDNIAAFLRGLFDTDGYVATSIVGYTSVSKKMISQVQQLLLCFGIISKISEAFTICNNKSFKSYKLCITDGLSIKKYAKYIGFECKRKITRLSKLLLRKTNPNIGNIPQNLVNQHIFNLENLRKQKKRFFSKRKKQYNSALISKYRLSLYKMSHITLGKILKIYKFAQDTEDYKTLLKIYNDDYYYSNIEDITYQTNDTYDVHIPADHSFLSNGMISHNTFCLALYILLKLRLVPGSKIVVCGAAFRQSKMVFSEASKMWDNGDVYRSTCGSKDGPHTHLDKCSITVGDSVAYFLPVGTGETIRGMRAHTVIMDEFGSVNPEVYEVVISGFGAVSKNPIETMNAYYRREFLIKQGEWTAEMEDAFINSSGNQSILSGTCGYDFDHFARYWRTYKKILESRGDTKKLEDIVGTDNIHKINWEDYSIIRIPYEIIPQGMMDANTVSRAKASMTSDSYNREYGAVFSKDSQGFIKSSLIRSCVASQKNDIIINEKRIIFSGRTHGDPKLKYIYGIDPASEIDNMAITILELHEDHTRIVYCWTVNRKRHEDKIRAGLVKEHDYFQYCVQKVRDLMVDFPCAGIYMDAQGGGRTLQQAMSTPRDGSTPIFPVVDPDDPKITDKMPGLHILHMCEFANTKWIGEITFGFKFDLEHKLLLFPDFNTIDLALSHEEDISQLQKAGMKIEDIQPIIGLYDTYEDCMYEIELLKEEIASIIHIKTPTGVDKWDTPEVKASGGKKKRLHKDRYTSLILANSGARTTGRLIASPPQYTVRGFISGMSDIKEVKHSPYTSGPLANLPAKFYGRVQR